MNNSGNEALFSALPPEMTVEEARHMSGTQLRELGLAHMAYLRTAYHAGVPLVSIHAADGTPLAVAEDERSAVEAIFEQEMVPVLVQ